MGVVHIEGFRHIPVTGDRTVITNASSGTTTWGRIANRSGGYALKSTNSLLNNSFQYVGVVNVLLPAGCLNLSVGFAMNFPWASGAPINNVNGITVDGSVTPQLFAVGFGAGQSLGSLATAAGITAGVVKDNSLLTVGWHWFNLVVSNFNSATGAYARLYQDGALMVEWAPDLLASTSQSMSWVRIYLGNANSAGNNVGYLADLIIRDDATIIPDSRVDVLSPTSDVAAGWTRSAGTTNFSLVDDAGPTVDTSDYVTSSTVAATDTYGLSDLPHNPSAVHGVMVNAVGRKVGVGSRTTCVMVNGVEGAAVDTGSAGTIVGAWDTNPSGGAAWTKTSVDAMTAGIRIKT